MCTKVALFYTIFWMRLGSTELRGDNYMLLAHRPYVVYCYLEFKLSYLKNLKLFSIRVYKRIIWACSFVKKRRRVLALFISIFLRNRSVSDARWFYGIKRKIGKGNLYLTENRLSWNEMCCSSDNHSYMYHTCAKEIFKFELQLEAVIDKISNFHDIAPNFTFSQIS